MRMWSHESSKQDHRLSTATIIPLVQELGTEKFVDSLQETFAEMTGSTRASVFAYSKSNMPRLVRLTGGSETMRISYLGLNTREMSVPNPLLKQKVREAIAHAVDREKIAKNVVGASATVPQAACYKSQFGCKQDVKQFKYDPALAKKLLAEAGYPNGMTLELAAYRSRDWADVVAGYLNAVGVKTNITFLQYAGAYEKVTSNSVHIFLGDWGSYSINDASALLNNFFTLAANDMNQDKELAELLTAASATMNPASRKVNYDKALTF